TDRSSVPSSPRRRAPCWSCRPPRQTSRQRVSGRSWTVWPIAPGPRWPGGCTTFAPAGTCAHSPTGHFSTSPTTIAHLVEEHTRLADVLELPVNRSRLAELAPEAGIGRMRERAVELAPDTAKNHWRDTHRFFRSGGSGEWRARTSATDREAYDRRGAELVPPELAAWAHHRRSATHSTSFDRQGGAGPAGRPGRTHA